MRAVTCPLAFLSGSPGMGELLIVFGAALILFGPRRLPELARMIGRALSELRHGAQEFKEQFMRMDETGDGQAASPPPPAAAPEDAPAEDRDDATPPAG